MSPPSVRMSPPSKTPLQIWVIPGAVSYPSIAKERCGCQSAPLPIYKAEEEEESSANNIQGWNLNGCNPYCLFGHVGYSFDKLPLTDPNKKIYGFGPADLDFFKNVYEPFPGAITNDTHIFREITLYEQTTLAPAILKQAMLAFGGGVYDVVKAKRYETLLDMRIFYIPAEVDLDGNLMGQLIKRLWDNGTLPPADLARITPTYIFPTIVPVSNTAGRRGWRRWWRRWRRG